MKRSGGLQQRKGSASHLRGRKGRFLESRCWKKIQRSGISAERGSWTVRCRTLAGYHMASQRLTLAYIFMRERTLVKSASLYLLTHSCVWKLLRVKGFSEVGPCPPAPLSSQRLKWSTKVFAPQRQLNESVPHVLPAALFAELHRNTTQEKSTGLKLCVLQAGRNTGLSLQTNLQCVIHREKFKKHTLQRERFIEFPVPMVLL